MMRRDEVLCSLPHPMKLLKPCVSHNSISIFLLYDTYD